MSPLMPPELMQGAPLAGAPPGAPPEAPPFGPEAAGFQQQPYRSLDPATAIQVILEMAQMDQQQFALRQQAEAAQFTAEQQQALSLAAQTIQQLLAQPPPETLNQPAGTEGLA